MTSGTQLAGRVAVVTGASGIIGREIAAGLAGAGADVVLAARGEDGLARAATRVRSGARGRIVTVATDVTSSTDVERLCNETRSHFGDAAILVNAAGCFGPLAALSRTDTSRWTETLLVNAIGPYLACRAFVPPMLAARWGRVINVSSAATLRPPRALGSAYATSKAALNQLTRHLAAEVAGTGVTANVIHPGSIHTMMTADVRAEVAALGEEGAPFRAWLEEMDRTGGDGVDPAVELVLELVGPNSESLNGGFHWPRDTLEGPLASW